MGRSSRRWSHRFGEAAERHVCEFLRARGVSVLHRRYRAPGGEIDIVANDDGWLALIEVKARSGTGFGAPAEAVGWRKQRRIVAASRSLLAAGEGRFRGVRFDVVEVRSARGQARITWIRDAFRP